MGSILKANCQNCYFSSTFLYGSGVQDFNTNCQVPAINRETGTFEVINTVGYYNTGKYTFYTDPILHKDNGDQPDLQWKEHELWQSNNYCPQCHKFTLEFITTGFLD